MPRLPYTTPSGETAAKISLRRGGHLTPLDMLLSHNDGLAHGWNSLLGAVRQEFSLTGDVRELVILRIAVLNDAAYEWAAHIDLGLEEGLPDDVVENIQQPQLAPTGNALYDAALHYTDESTLNVSIADETFDAVRQFYTDSQVVELTALVASYNMVSRFLVAMGVTAADRAAVTTTD